MSFVDGFLNLFKVQDDEFDDDYDYDEEFDDDEDDDKPSARKKLFSGSKKSDDEDTSTSFTIRTQEERLFQLSRQREVLK